MKSQRTRTLPRTKISTTKTNITIRMIHEPQPIKSIRNATSRHRAASKRWSTTVNCTTPSTAIMCTRAATRMADCRWSQASTRPTSTRRRRMRPRTMYTVGHYALFRRRRRRHLPIRPPFITATPWIPRAAHAIRHQAAFKCFRSNRAMTRCHHIRAPSKPTCTKRSRRTQLTPSMDRRTTATRLWTMDRRTCTQANRPPPNIYTRALTQTPPLTVDNRAKLSHRFHLMAMLLARSMVDRSIWMNC